VLTTKAKSKHKPKQKIKRKNKSYSLRDCGLFKITSKKILEKRLLKSIDELNTLKNDANYSVFDISQSSDKTREIQTPNFDLDVIHTRIASLLARVKMPDYVHSGVKGRSNITNAKIHVGDHPVLTMDIRKFYQSISKKSVYQFFLSKLACAPDVAGILAELCTYNDHIPTGSRLSMLLAFWANQTMYEEFYMLCESTNVTMSSYVDDLTFSGIGVNRGFERKVERIINNAGLTIHPEKTKLYRRDKPKLITGVIIDKNTFRVRHKHHKAIYVLFNNMENAKTEKELQRIHQKILGSLNAAGQIDPVFKQRSIQFKAARNSN